MSREQSAKGFVAPRGTRSFLMLLPCEPRHSPKEGLLLSLRSG